MQTPILPRQLNQNDFDAFTSNWSQLVNGNDPDLLRSCFTRNDTLLNYVYIPGEFATVWDDSPAEIRLKFVVVPGNAPTDPSVFSIAFYGIDDDGTPVSGYYLAGVAAVRAQVEEDPSAMNAEIPYEEAARWIKYWNALSISQVSKALFDTGDGMLLGYTYPTADFQDAWQPSGSLPTPALWLNFVLHDPTPPAELGLFSTVLALNSIPVGNVPGVLKLSPKEDYYDISRPCPPYC